MATEIASLFAKIGADVSGFKKGMSQVDGDLRGGHSRLGAFTGALGAGIKVAAGVAVGGLVALGGAIAATTSKAATMQQAIADITADMGLNAEETQKVSDLISDLGIDPRLKVTATEAAQAIHMLGKNGQSVSDILGGTARATVLLANSTGGDFATSADIATDVMAQFKIRAEDMMDVVNGITGTTRSSKFDINHYRLALAQAGGVAASVGVSFEDFNATIAAISPVFASGSDAGTSFKTFLARLNPETKPAAAAMKALGIITADGANQFFTATGEMKSMSEIAGVLKTAFAGLSEQEKLHYSQVLFGTDAQRAAFALAEAGAETIDALKTKIGNTDAEESAAIRMGTLSGQWEIFTGIVEGLATKIGQRFLPYAEKFTAWAIDMSSKWGPSILNWFDKAMRGVEGLISWVGKFLSGNTDLSGYFGETGEKVMRFVNEVVALFTDTPIAQVWQDLWVEVKRTLLAAWVYLQDTFGNLVDVLTGAVRIIRGIVSGDWSLAWDGIKQVAIAMANQLFDTLRFLFSGSDTWRGILTNGLQWIVNQDWAQAWENVKSIAINAGQSLMSAMSSIFQPMGPLLADMLVNPLKYAINRFIDAHNMFIRVANGSIGRLPGGFMIPEIPTPFPGYAAGGRFTKGGMALVGERGPELVDLPGGSYVHNSRDTAGMLDGGATRVDVYVHADGTMPSDRNAIREMARALQRELGLVGARVVMP